MKKRVFFCALALAGVSAQGYRVALHNKSGYFIRVNIGAQARSGSYHVQITPGQSRVVETSGYIPSWLSAYSYPTAMYSKRNEKILVEDLGLPNAFFGGDKISCCIYNDRVETSCGDVYSDDSGQPIIPSNGYDF